MAKEIKVDTLKLRSHMLDMAYDGKEGLPQWNGIKSGSYLNRKTSKEYVINKLNNLIDHKAINITLQEQCRKAVIIIDENMNEWEIIDRLMKHGIHGYYSGKVIID
ncbi:hypothetical protein JOC34_000478 [Virgibacillus halotolerans]|nr:hypothetical protein [Virgibacillus halotolerans]